MSENAKLLLEVQYNLSKVIKNLQEQKKYDEVLGIKKVKEDITKLQLRYINDIKLTL